MNKKKSIQKSIKNSVLIEHLSVIVDPRIDRTKKHHLIDILVIAICAAICGAKTWIDIEDFGKSKESWFKGFLSLSHGIPSHDTFRRLFLLLDPEAFISWVQALTKDTNLEQICVDGKTLLRSFNKAKGISAIHMVNAWSTGASLCLGQLKSEGKSNEIETVPKLLDLLNIKGCLVSLDAMNCQKKIAEKIDSQGGEYLLSLKSNHRYLHKRVEAAFDNLSQRGGRRFHNVEVYKEKDKGHGREEERVCTVLKAREGKSLGVNPFSYWPRLKSLIRVESKRLERLEGKKSCSIRFFISSSDISARDFSLCIRRHWEVENKLHWVLDVSFKEDESSCSSGYSAENFSMLRQFALNLVKKEGSQKAVRRKQNIAGWDERFLLKILIGNDKLDA